jgi:branched-subunit amino acid transport protein
VRPSVFAYIAIMSAVTLGTRILPLTLIRRPITNRFLRSFLFYVPYVTLAVMTFPAILSATDSPLAGAAALAVGIGAAWMGASLPQVAAGCCGVVFVLELLLA